MPPAADTRVDARIQLVQRLAEFRYDPYGYALYAFPWGRKGTELEHVRGPRAWQRRKLERIGRKLREGKESLHQIIREATCSGHGIGKSALVAMVIKWAVDTLADTKVVVTANTEKQLQTKTWPELAKWHYMSISRDLFVFTATSLYSVDSDHEKTWRADAIPWSENNTEAFAGLHNATRRVVLLFDEASAIADKVWEVAEGALTDERTEIIWCVFGNGTRATGRFRECWRAFRKWWDTEEIDSRDVEGTNKELFAEWVEKHGEDSDFVKIRVRGMFPAAGVKSLISEADVDPAYGRHLRPEQYNFAPKIISLDGGWTGEDEIVIGMRQGLASQILHVMARNDNDVWLAGLLARFEDEQEADAVWIDQGYGTGVYSCGVTWGRAGRLVDFAGASTDPGCLNARAQMGKKLRDWLKTGAAIPQHSRLREDLLAVEIVERTDGKLQLEAKKEMKKRGLPSPGYGDALYITFAYPDPIVRRREFAGVNYGLRGGGMRSPDWNADDLGVGAGRGMQSPSWDE